jgi:hypothetical protein
VVHQVRPHVPADPARRHASDSPPGP